MEFGRALNGDWQHPVATELGARWGTAPPRFVRSSASHVLVADRAEGGRLVLRLRPAGESDTLHRASRAAQEWSAAGAPMVAPVLSSEGRAVEPAGGYVAMALEVVEGPTLDELDGELVGHAADWGEALARLHSVRLTVPGLPDSSDLPLPRTPEVFGTLHGDPEADNVVLSDSGLCFVDPDDVHLGWFAADIVFALRDWATPGLAPDLATEVPRLFIEGYRRARPLSEEELSWMPLLAREAARKELAAYLRHLDSPPGQDWPEWASRLDLKVRERATALRASLSRQ